MVCANKIAEMAIIKVAAKTSSFFRMLNTSGGSGIVLRGRILSEGRLSDKLQFVDPVDQRQAKAYRTSAADKFVGDVQGNRTRRYLRSHCCGLQSQGSARRLHIHARREL